MVKKIKFSNYKISVLVNYNCTIFNDSYFLKMYIQRMKKFTFGILVIFIINCDHNDRSTLEIEPDENNIYSFQISQIWSQEPEGYRRNVFYKYPVNTNDNIPVAIILHGNGGNPIDLFNEYNYPINHIIIAPEGYENSWNIGRESSKAPDTDFINQIINNLNRLENVDEDNISIIGYSNGSALVNQLLIELQSEAFKKAVCEFCQLNTLQYQDDRFWSRSNIDSDVYDLETSPASNSKILSLAGTNDTTCNYYGGQGIFDYNFINAEEAAFIWAKVMGYNGDAITNPSQEIENFNRFSYLDNKVVHYGLNGLGHGYDESFNESKSIIKNFLEN